MRPTVEETARKMGVTPQFVRMGLRQERLPFGTAVKFEKRWSYYINGRMLDRYLKGELN